MKKNRSIIWAIVILLTFPYTLFSQDKLLYIDKLDLESPSEFDYFGTAIDATEEYLAVSAPGSKKVYIYQKDPNSDSWGLIHTLQGPSEADGYGEAISIHKSNESISVAVGAPYQDYEGMQDVGRVYCYNGNNNWEMSELFDAVSPQAGDRFGAAIDIHGNMLAIGAPYKENDVGGRAYTYFYSPDGTWEFDQIKTAANAAGFAASVTLENNTLIVGAQDDIDGNLPQCDINGGLVFVYYREGGEWVEQKKFCFSSPNPDINGKFACSLEVDGDILAVGGRQVDMDENNTGVVNIYRKDEGGPDNWGLVSTISNPSHIFGEYALGTSVSLYDDIVIAGAPGVNESLKGVATTNVSGFNDVPDSWGLFGVAEPAGAADGDAIGAAVENNAEYYFVGAPGTYKDGIAFAGAIYIYRNCYKLDGFAYEPEDQTVCAGAEVSLHVELGISNITYQWQKDGEDLTDIPGVMEGANTFKITIFDTKGSDTGTYSCIVSSPCDDPIISESSLVVNEVPTADTPMSDETICIGSSIELNPNFGGNDDTYQWFKDGQLLADKTNSSLALINLTVEDGGTYKCVASNDCGQAEDDVTLTITDNISISQQTEDLLYCEGEQIELQVNTSNQDLSFQWYLDGAPIANATAQNLIIESFKAADAGFYTVDVTASCGAPIDVQVATIGIFGNLEVTTISDNIDVRVGDPFSLEIEVNGEPVSYKWSLDGKELTDEGAISGTNTSTLKITAAEESHTGEYMCTVYGSCDELISETVQVVVTKDAPDQITSVNKESFVSNIYPNPTNGQLNLVFERSGMGKILIYDSRGILADIFVLEGLANQYSLNISHLPKGLYFMTVVQNNRDYKYRISLQ